ncbi:MAG: GNAT family N-acetyltransferase [Candidatus Omnitrophota bacterium]|jgi:N-acetylglutamate synthase-like GNAT family acetyltransferase
MVEIRRFAPGDEKAVARLINDIMGVEFREDQSAYPTEDIQDIPRSYGGLGEGFFVAVSGGEIVGTVGLKKEDERSVLLRRLFVSPNHRKKKIGTKLIERALKFCDEVGYREVIFRTTSRMRSAAEVCQKCGFIQRAKLSLGPVELFKFVYSLHGSPAKS